MNILVAYYSRTGTTSRVARELATSLGADIGEIQDTANRSGPIGYLRSGFQAVSNKQAVIRPFGHSCAGYDIVVIGTPVWAGRMSSPARAFMLKYGSQIRSAALFCTMGSSGAKKTLVGMQSELACPVIATAQYKAKAVRGDLVAQLVGPFAQEILSAASSRDAAGSPRGQGAV